MNREKIIELYVIYKNLFSEKQQEYFENYYYEDYSLSEISENLKVIRSIVNKTIKIVENKLLKYEEILKIKNKMEKIDNFSNQLSKKLKEELKKINV